MSESTQTLPQITVPVPIASSKSIDQKDICSIQSSDRVPRCYFLDLRQLNEADGQQILTRPLRVNICEDDEGVRAENEELAIFAFGSTSSEAVDDFERALLSSWEGLKNLPDEELTQDAIDLRNKLSAFFSV